MSHDSCYTGSEIILTTKHSKSLAIAPAFLTELGATIVESNVDTDTLGTFSGEIQRQGTALECVRHKCEWGMSLLDAEYGLASEGSFGPHPSIPFIACDQEILYFIDLKRGFELHLTKISQDTNYWMQVIGSIEELEKKLVELRFPSHALIIRPNIPDSENIFFKGINSYSDLHDAIKESMVRSKDSKAWVETDMRADKNPTRMALIGELAMELSKRLATMCEACGTPGWGKVRAEVGLECSDCGSPTELTRAEIFGCAKCTYSVSLPRSDGLSTANPMYCAHCNP